MVPLHIKGSIMPPEALGWWYQRHIDSKTSFTRCMLDATKNQQSSHGSIMTQHIDLHYSNERGAYKRRKLNKDTTTLTFGQIAFPAQCPQPAKQLIDAMKNETLTAVWSYSSLPDSIEIGTVKLMTAITQQVVLENEMVFSSLHEEDGNSSGDQCYWLTSFFVNLARLSSHGSVITQHVDLQYSDEYDAYNCIAVLTLSAPTDRNVRNQLFTFVFPYLHPVHTEPSSGGGIPIDDFYRHLQPTVSNERLTKCQTPRLLPTLTPFQSQNVEWMALREGFNVLNDGTLVEHPARSNRLPYLWEKLDVSPNGQHLYINRITHDMTSNIVQGHPRLYHGGILADEMGLGKTVSAIALILLNSIDRSNLFNTLHVPELKKTGATLIITPATIIHQWEKEFRKHAPTLKVTLYEGIKCLPHNMSTEQVADMLAANDIVLTSYSTLQGEIYYARATPDRPRRFSVKHTIRKSPLVQLLWWRCILDEAQRVESPVTQTAEMASLIPRYFSWAVTGTPIKSSHYEDLYGLCKFVDYIGDMTLSQFKSLFSSPMFQPMFMHFTKEIMRRNLKSFLQDQVHIPKQHRRVINISFSTIEQHYYNDLQAMCQQDADPAWLDSTGWVRPARENPGYIKYIESMQALRKWLHTLRETCVHPAVVGRNQEDIRTLDQVLKIMIQKTKDRIEDAQSSLANDKLTYGGMHELIKQDWKIPLSIYLDWTPHVERMVKEYDDRLESQRRNKIENTTNQKMETEEQRNDVEESKTLIIRQTSWQNILHRFYFYTAGVYHMLESKENEDAFYDKAANVRRQILQRPQQRVVTSIEEVRNADTGILSNDIRIGFSPQKETLLLSNELLNRVDELAEIMNEQLALIQEWRVILQKYLTSNLVDSNEDDVMGDEYDNSLIIQQNCDVYQDLYQDILRDRYYWVHGVWIAPRANATQQSDVSEEMMNEETKDLREKLNSERQRLAPNENKTDSLRLLVAEFREIGSGPNVLHKVESHVIQSETNRLTREFKCQKDVQEALESEYRKFSTLSNHRIEYYRALQNISDHVQTWECSDPQAKIATLESRMANLQNTIDTQISRMRYLENVESEKQEKEGCTEDEKKLVCLICKENFVKGIVTYCGHMYCEFCALAWFRQSSRCPQCNSNVTRYEWYSISWKTATVQQSDLEENDQVTGTNGASGSSVSSAILKEISKTTIQQGLGAKLDSVIRHIKYIQQTNNGKCLVFSQWNQVLGLISEGLSRNGIGYVSFTSGRKDDAIVQFKEDKHINVMLLHARSQSSGLTLLEAKTVFIIEPVLNESLEKQAISRVHRIGQTDETSVYWYIVRDTIEERIQLIHNAKQRHRQIMNKDDMEVGTIDVPHMASKLEGGGEYVSDDDLRQCFTQINF